MLTGSMIELVRRRWRSERPYAGHTSESLRHKIQSPAISPQTKAAAERGLQLRTATVIRSRIVPSGFARADQLESQVLGRLPNQSAHQQQSEEQGADR